MYDFFFFLVIGDIAEQLSFEENAEMTSPTFVMNSGSLFENI